MTTTGQTVQLFGSSTAVSWSTATACSQQPVRGGSQKWLKIYINDCLSEKRKEWPESTPMFTGSTGSTGSTVRWGAQSESIRFAAPPCPNLYGLLHRPIWIYPVSTIYKVKVQLEKSVSLVDCRDMCRSEMLFSFSQATLSIFVSYLRRTPLAYVP